MDVIQTSLADLKVVTRAIRAGGGRQHPLYGEVQCGERPRDRLGMSRAWCAE